LNQTGGAVNDVHANVINGKTYVAVGTDETFSVINTTDQTIYDYADNAVDDYNAVWLTSKGQLYAVNETTAALERWDNIPQTADAEVLVLQTCLG
jgi:hypothetical protein